MEPLPFAVGERVRHEDGAVGSVLRVERQSDGSVLVEWKTGTNYRCSAPSVLQSMKDAPLPAWRKPRP